MKIEVTLEGQEALIDALQKNGNLAPILADSFERIGEHARSASRERAPHDRGKLRNSIIYKLDPPNDSGIVTGVRIGTIGGAAPRYAAWMEYGTGLMHDHPSWPKKEHFMGRKAAKALKAWGDRTGKGGMGAFWTIRERGGIVPKRYLRSVLEENGSGYVNVIRVAIGRFKIG
jgi:hypothetical protein